MPRNDAIAAAFTAQACHCDGYGSTLYGELCRRCADDVRAGGELATLLADWNGDPQRGSLPLRVLGGVHALVLTGQAPALSACYPSTGGVAHWPHAWHAFLATVQSHREAIHAWLPQPPQTNEVGRSGSLLGGLLQAAASGLPLRLLELGSSAGLNLRVDHFRIALGERWFGPADARVVLRPAWTGPTPAAVPLHIASRAGCDLAPIDVRDPAARLRLQAYVWPDRPDRLATLRAALAVAQDVPVDLDRAEAVDWLAQQLAAPCPGLATVVFHSSFHGYLPAATQQRLAAILQTAGDRATARAPVYWLRCEDEVPLPADRAMQHEVRLRGWPGNAERLLARCQPHGDRVAWLAQP